MEVACSSETFVSDCNTMCCHSPDYPSVDTHHCTITVLFPETYIRANFVYTGLLQNQTFCLAYEYCVELDLMKLKRTSSKMQY
jgi:hypothetical protein